MQLERAGIRADIVDDVEIDDQRGHWAPVMAVLLPALAREHSDSPLAPTASARLRRKYPNTMTNVLELETDLCASTFCGTIVPAFPQCS